MATVNCCRTRLQKIQRFSLFLIDVDLDQEDYKKMTMSYQLDKLTKSATTLSISTQTVELIQETKCEKSFIIINGSSQQSFISSIHSIDHIESIYILDSDRGSQDWSKYWNKVKGAFINIKCIYDVIEKEISQINHDDIHMEIVDLSHGIIRTDLSHLDSGFMYTSLLGNAIFNMEHNQLEQMEVLKKNIIEKYKHKLISEKELERFSQNYNPSLAVNWYTQPTFIYELVNESLRSLDCDIIVDTAFFIKDLHRQIFELHNEQLGNYRDNQFTLYRGQALSQEKFEKICQSKGSLLAFNCFLSTTVDHEVALAFAESSGAKPGHIPVRFKITIELNQTSVPFANIRNNSNHSEEEEYLFSMNTIFRIGDVSPVERFNNVFEIQLISTTDEDPELKLLMEFMETQKRGTGFYHIACIICQVGQLEKAEEILLGLLDKNPQETHEYAITNQLGAINIAQGQYKEALQYYKQSLELNQKLFSDETNDLATCYGNVGLACEKLGTYNEALSYYEKAFIIRQKILSGNDLGLALSYQQFGSVFYKMGDYKKAMLYNEQALLIRKSALPAIHPDLTASYNNIAQIHVRLAEYSKALSMYQNVLATFERALPSNHYYVAEGYNGLGMVYDSMGDYALALQNYKRAHDILQHAFRWTHHPSVIGSYCNIGNVYDHMREYQEALLVFEQALKLQNETLPYMHPDLSETYDKVAGAHFRLGNNEKALYNCELAQNILKAVLPQNHPDLANSYHNTGLVYARMNRFTEAFRYYEQAISIRQEIFIDNHPSIAQCYCSIGALHAQMENYTDALSYNQIALSIVKTTLPEDHPSVAGCYNNLGVTYFRMGNYTEALSNHEKALIIRKQKLSNMHPDIIDSYINIGLIYDRIGDYTLASYNYEQALAIQERILPENHPMLARAYINLAMIYTKSKNTPQVLRYLRKAFLTGNTLIPTTNPLA